MIRNLEFRMRNSAVITGHNALGSYLIPSAAGTGHPKALGSI